MSSVYDILTDRILKLLDSGTAPWRKDWSEGARPMNISGRCYNGINRLLLGHAEYGSPVFGTYHQFQAMGANVRRGESGLPVFFFKMMQDRNDPKHLFPIFRYSTAFNVEQCDNVKLPPKVGEMIAEAIQRNQEARKDPIAGAEAIVRGMPNAPKIIFSEMADGAFYRPSTDSVTVPTRERFNSTNEYYNTLFHELSHSTGHASRLNRDEIVKPTNFGCHEYGVEELTAEMAASFLDSECGIDNTVLANNAAYIAGWRNIISADHRLVMKAASRGQKAADYIMNRIATAPKEGS